MARTDFVNMASAYRDRCKELEQQLAALVEALEALVLAFDVGDLGHLTLNGRGYSALEDARQAIALVEGDE